MNESRKNLNKRIADLERLLSVTRAMNAEKNLDGLLHVIVNSITELLDAERSSLWIVDGEKQTIFTRVAEGDGIGTLDMPIGVGIAGSVAASGETVNIRDAYADERFNPDFDRKTGYRTRSILCMPLENRDGQIVGVAQVLNKRGGPFDEYDENLLSTLAAQAGVVLERLSLRELEFRQKKLEADLELAKDIQQRLLPDGAPTFDRMQVAGFNRPADETGGDYYDFVPVSGGKLGILVGDVSGHGLPSALVMASARAMMRAMVLGGLNAGEILERANALLSEDLEDDRFMTMLFAVMDTETLALEYASAGHEPPLIYRSATGDFFQPEMTGMPLGMFEDAEYEIQPPLQLDTGDVAVFYTDGVFEAMNEADEEFGMERFKEVVVSVAGDEPERIIHEVVTALDNFVSGRPQKDDITLAVVKVVG